MWKDVGTASRWIHLTGSAAALPRWLVGSARNCTGLVHFGAVGQQLSSARLRSFTHTHARTHTKISLPFMPEGGGCTLKACEKAVCVAVVTIEGLPSSGPANWFGFVIEKKRGGGRQVFSPQSRADSGRRSPRALQLPGPAPTHMRSCQPRSSTGADGDVMERACLH